MTHRDVKEMREKEMCIHESRRSRQISGISLWVGGWIGWMEDGWMNAWMYGWVNIHR